MHVLVGFTVIKETLGTSFDHNWLVVNA